MRMSIFSFIFGNSAKEKAIKEHPTQEKGKAIWAQLNKELPKAVGVLCDDKPRILAYAERVKQMSGVEKASLKLYLEYLLDFHDDSGDVVSGSVEELCRRKRQICSQHLEYL